MEWDQEPEEEWAFAPASRRRVIRIPPKAAAAGAAKAEGVARDAGAAQDAAAGDADNTHWTGPESRPVRA